MHLGVSLAISRPQISGGYAAIRDAAIAAARNNNAALWFAGAPADLAGFVYQDSTGATPATGTDPVGLLLDRSYGADPFGSELILNGDFSGGTTGWVFGSGWSLSSGRAVSSAPAGQLYRVAGPFTVGLTYKIAWNSTTTDSITINCGSTFVAVTQVAGNNQVILTCTGSSGLFFSGAGTYSIDDISVKQLLGYPATQATAASKPTLLLNAAGYFGWLHDGTDFLSDGYLLSNTASHTLITSATCNSALSVRTIATGGGAASGNPRVAQIRINQTTGRFELVYLTDGGTVSSALLGATNYVNTPVVLSAVFASGTATGYANGTSQGSLSVNAGATTVISAGLGTALGAAPELFSGVIYLKCACAGTMPDADRIAIERFAALLSGASYS